MGLTSEIYLNKKNISSEEWLKLIKVISNYNGFFRKWKLIITNDKNQIRFFIKTRCSLPPTINNLNSFLLKPTNNIGIPRPKYIFLHFSKDTENIIDLINYSEIKNKGTLIYFEIFFKRLPKGKIKSKVRFYLNKNGIIQKYVCLFVNPFNMLSVDFEGNKRYFYKGSPKYLDISKILHLLNTDTNNALLSIDTFPYLQGNFYLNQNNFSFDKHSIIMGSSGTGKSKFISLLINNINKNETLKQKYRIVVIDPHSSLENDIGGIGRVIEFKNDLNSIDLFINNKEDTITSTELLLDLFKSLISERFNPKLERVLRHSIYLLLTYEKFNFRNLRKLILDLEFRNNLIKELRAVLPISTIDFFLSDFNELKTKSYGEAISPIIGFIDEMEMIPVFNSNQKYDGLKDVVNDNFLTLFSLDRTKLGDKVTKTISGLIMQQLFTIMGQRLDKPVIFIIDEVPVIQNPILSRFLSEARKYNLSLILIGQYFNQITDELKSSIFANVINYFIFKVSRIDANSLVDNISMKIPLDDSRDKKINVLTGLQPRECIARVEANGVLLPAFKGKTVSFESIPRTENSTPFIKGSTKCEDNKPKPNFKIDKSINLKNILISNSTGRKDV